MRPLQAAQNAAGGVCFVSSFFTEGPWSADAVETILGGSGGSFRFLLVCPFVGTTPLVLVG